MQCISLNKLDPINRIMKVNDWSKLFTSEAVQLNQIEFPLIKEWKIKFHFRIYFATSLAMNIWVIKIWKLNSHRVSILITIQIWFAVVFFFDDFQCWIMKWLKRRPPPKIIKNDRFYTILNNNFILHLIFLANLRHWT